MKDEEKAEKTRDTIDNPGLSASQCLAASRIGNRESGIQNLRLQGFPRILACLPTYLTCLPINLPTQYICSATCLLAPPHHSPLHPPIPQQPPFIPVPSILVPQHLARLHLSIAPRLAQPLPLQLPLQLPRHLARQSPPCHTDSVSGAAAPWLTHTPCFTGGSGRG